MRLLLDTATFIFAVESPDRLSRRAALALENTEDVLELSSISVAEIAIKAAAGKFNFTSDSVQRGLQDLSVRILPYVVDHALELFGLPVKQRDPFDRQIIAQALVEGIPIVTPDRAFHLYKNVKVIW